MKSRVAICISGQCRTWESCYENIINFFQDDECQFDYFIHTWDINTYPEISNNVNYFYNSDPQAYVTAYNPKLFKIESYQKFQLATEKIKKNDIKGSNTLALMYSFKKSISLKKIYERQNKFKYDYVVKLRPDIFFINQNFRNHIKELTNKKNSFLTYFQFQNNWEKNLDSTWGPDLYWMFNDSDLANKFSTFFRNKNLYEKESTNIYTFYRHTLVNNLTPINLNANFEKFFPMSICRPYHLPFINNFNTKFDETIYKKIYFLDSMFVKNGSNFFIKIPMFLDLVIENNKIYDLKKNNIVNFLIENNTILETIRNNLNNYLHMKEW